MAQKKVRENQVSFDVERAKFLQEIAEKEIIVETINEQKANNETFQRRFEQQLEDSAQQAQQIAELRKAQMEMDQAMQYYEEVRRNPAFPPQEVDLARSILIKCQQTYKKLMSIPRTVVQFICQ